MGKVQEMKQKVEEAKKRLDHITVVGESPSKKVSVVINGNRVVKSISVSPELLKGDREELEDMLVLAINNGLVRAERVNESEMQGTAKGMLPNLPGMNF